MSAALVEVRGLVAEHAGRGRVVRAVDGVDLDVARGEIVGLVGESGAGKTTLGRAILRLVEPKEGVIRFDGIDVRALGPAALRRLRRRMQIVFQDPGAALNPRMTAGALVAEPLAVHGLARGAALETEVLRLLEAVGLEPGLARRHPRDLSGGQRQRVAIARALAVRPELVVCDEPVASLDVSVQAQVVNLLVDLQRRTGMSYLFISHDLELVGHLCDRVLVMYGGRVVEEARARDLVETPLHPYSRVLLPGRSRPPAAAGTPVDRGCRYAPHCPLAQERCLVEDPRLRQLLPSHRVACHRAEECAVVPPPIPDRDHGAKPGPDTPKETPSP